MIREQENSFMHRTMALLGFCAAAIVAGCSASASPAEVSNEATQFPVVAHWTAGASPIAPATVAGQLTFDQRLGYHSDVTFVVNGPPNGVFQWRIFKRDCSVTRPLAMTRPQALPGAAAGAPVPRE